MINYIKKNKVKFVYLPLAIYWLILFIATSLPTEYMPSVGVGDKYNHFFAYLGLGFLLYYAFSFQEKFLLLKKYPFIMAIIIASVYGIFDELHQLLIPGRSAEFLDWLADFFGAMTGVLIARFIYIRFRMEAEEID